MLPPSSNFKPSPLIQVTSSRLEVPTDNLNLKQASKKEKLAKILADIGKVKSVFYELKDSIKEIDFIKREVYNSIISTSFEYERYTNEQKFRLLDAEDNFQKMIQTLKEKQEQKEEILCMKNDQINSLKVELRQVKNLNSSLNESKRAKDEALARIQTLNQHEIQDLNLKINDLLAIIHENTQRIDVLENQNKKSRGKTPLLNISQQNVSSWANSRINNNTQLNTQSGQCREKVNKIHIKRYPVGRKPFDQGSCQLSLFTATQDQGQNNQKNCDNQIIAKLQRFVNDLTSTRNDENFVTKNSNQSRELFKCTQWSQTLRKGQHKRRHSGQIGIKKDFIYTDKLY